MPIIQINSSRILVLSRNIVLMYREQVEALLLLLLQFCLLKVIIKGITPWTPEVPQWHSAFEQCEKVSRSAETDWLTSDVETGCEAVCVWLYDVQVCVEYLSSERVHSCVYVSGGDCEMIVWCQTNLRLTQRDHVNSRLFQLLDKREQNRRHCLRSALNWAFLYLPCTASYMWLGPPPARSDTGPPFLH